MTRIAWAFSAWLSFLVAISCFWWLLRCEPKADDIAPWLLAVLHVVGIGAGSTAWCLSRALRP